MAFKVTGYRTDSDAATGNPSAVPSQIMSSEFGTPEEVISYVRSYNRMMAPGKTFLFSLSGNAEPSAEDDTSMAVATAVFFHILNNLGGQLTQILSDEYMSSCIPEDRYDMLVEAQNRIVEVLVYMGGPSDTGLEGAAETGEVAV